MNFWRKVFTKAIFRSFTFLSFGSRIKDDVRLRFSQGNAKHLYILMKESLHGHIKLEHSHHPNCTNSRTSKDYGCHFSNIQCAGHSFLFSTTFTLLLLECKFAQPALICPLLILLCENVRFEIQIHLLAFENTNSLIYA